MIEIRVAGTPAECEAFCEILEGVQRTSETPIILNVVQTHTQPHLSVIQGGKRSVKAGDRQAVELPTLT